MALIEFQDYSKEYDNLLRYSTPYIELMSTLKILLEKYLPAKKEISVLDVGAGTGNISKVIENSIQVQNINKMVLVEPSEEMLSIARTKLNGNNIEFSPTTFEEFHSTKKFDLIVCVHALYLMPDPAILIDRFSQFMDNNSLLIICDIGSEIKISRWARHLLYTNSKKYGILVALKALFANKEIKKANKEISKKQRSGEIWSHTLEEFSRLFSNKYTILENMNTFLGCSNLLVCKKKSN